MERGEGVLAHGLDGHRKNLLVPVSLEQSFGCRSYIYNGVNNLQAHYRWYVTDCF